MTTIRERSMLNWKATLLGAALCLVTTAPTFAQTVGNVNLVKVWAYGRDSGNANWVDLYQSDHGIVSVVNANPDCMPTQGGTAGMAGYLVNPEYYGVHELIPMGSSRLPNLGGGERGFVDCALTLGVYHPGAHGKIVSAS